MIIEYTLTDINLTDYLDKIIKIKYDNTEIKKDGDEYLALKCRDEKIIAYNSNDILLDVSLLENNKYNYIGMLYLLNKGMGKKRQIKFTKSELENFIGITICKSKLKDYIRGITDLMKLHIGYTDPRTDGKKISVFITSFNYIQTLGMYEIEFGPWLDDLIVYGEINYIKSKFISGTVDYSGYMSEKVKRVESINIPQRIINHYRINQNKKGIRWYDTSEYLAEIWLYRKRFQKRDILSEVKKINKSLSDIGIKIVFDSDVNTLSPKKFKASKFKIIENH